MFSTLVVNKDVYIRQLATLFITVLTPLRKLRNISNKNQQFKYIN